MSPVSFSSSQTTGSPGDIGLTQIQFLLFTHHFLFWALLPLACPPTIPWHPYCCVPTPLWTSVSSIFPVSNCLKKSTFIGLWMWKHNILLKVNCGLLTIFSDTNLTNYPLPMPTNRDDNSMLYPRLHSLLTICLSPQTWSFHQRQSLSTPVSPYTPQYSYPLRAPALDLVQSSTAQALCCRMTQPPPIL